MNDGRAYLKLGVGSFVMMLAGLGLSGYAPNDVPGLMAALDNIGFVLSIVGGVGSIVGIGGVSEKPWHCKACKLLEKKVEDRDRKILELEEVLITDGRLVEKQKVVVKYLPAKTIKKPQRRKR